MFPSTGAAAGIFCIRRWRWNRKKAKASAATPRTARAIPTPKAALEPDESPEEADSPSLLRGRPVCDEEVVEEAPELADVAERASEEDVDEDLDDEVEEEVENDDDEEDVLDDVDDEDVEVAIFQPLICTPTTCVEPSVVLVSDQGPESVRV